jgi:hypothetical protein
MIPYDDLVVALATWRARQGLPVVQVAGAPPPPPPAPAPLKAAAPPPATRATPRRPVAAVVPETAALDDFDEGAMVVEDGHYDPGDDYVVPLGGEPGEATAIGAAPQPSAGKRPPGSGW